MADSLSEARTFEKPSDSAAGLGASPIGSNTDNGVRWVDFTGRKLSKTPVDYGWTAGLGHLNDECHLIQRGVAAR